MMSAFASIPSMTSARSTGRRCASDERIRTSMNSAAGRFRSSAYVTFMRRVYRTARATKNDRELQRLAVGCPKQFVEGVLKLGDPRELRFQFALELHHASGEVRDFGTKFGFAF